MPETEPLGSGQMLKGCAELMKSIGPFVELVGPMLPVLLQAAKCFSSMDEANRERVAAFLSSQVENGKQEEIKQAILEFKV